MAAGGLVQRWREIAEDPMWADHVEVTKLLVRFTADRLEADERVRVKAQALYDALLRAERHEGGLIGTDLLRLRDELGLELQRWSK